MLETIRNDIAHLVYRFRYAYEDGSILKFDDERGFSARVYVEDGQKHIHITTELTEGIDSQEIRDKLKQK